LTPVPDERRPVAVVDLGSNSGRVVVFRMAPPGHLEILADGRSPLRLTKDIGERARLSDEAIDRTVAALADFTAIADGTSAGEVLAVATAAVRDAENGDLLVERIRRETGMEVRVVDGEEEARYSFIGAVHGVAADQGALMDVGGGSMELTSFRDRRYERSWTLPLGSLRLSERFLRSDAPTEQEMARLEEHVREALEAAGVPKLRPDERLVGTGGTIRNLAKVDRRSANYPIRRIHGYVLSRKHIGEVIHRLASRPSSRRALIPGLNGDRADSIVGGALVTKVTMETIGAEDLIVSGQGLREGIFYDLRGDGLPPPEQVRRTSVAALVTRFSSWDGGRAHRRRALAVTLLTALEPEAGRKTQERLEQAATILDIGRSIDYYRRHAHAADIVIEADLDGFSHRKLALLAAVIREAGEDDSVLRLYRPLLGSADRIDVSRSSAILALADEIEHRMPPGAELPIRCAVRKQDVRLTAPLYDPYRQAVLGRPFRKAFGRRLVIDPGTPPPEGSSAERST
jgi:exopolyphosphatase/guanosine-5'-triphosphate,3'-diphosphate pyrophosphatase